MRKLAMDGKVLLGKMYTTYQARLEAGCCEAEAICFGTMEEIRQMYLKPLGVNDVTVICFELARAGMLLNGAIPGATSGIRLTDAGIFFGSLYVKITKQEIRDALTEQMR